MGTRPGTPKGQKDLDPRLAHYCSLLDHGLCPLVGGDSLEGCLGAEMRFPEHQPGADSLQGPPTVLPFFPKPPVMSIKRDPRPQAGVLPGGQQTWRKQWLSRFRARSESPRAHLTFPWEPCFHDGNERVGRRQLPWWGPS